LVKNQVIVQDSGMRIRDSALLVLSRGAMELAWRYAWAFFLVFLSMGVVFPLFAGAGILCASALLNRASQKWGWQNYWMVLFNIIGIVVCVLLFLHHYRYPAYPFWSMAWLVRLVGDPSGIVEWFLLFLTGYCLILVWQGGRYLKKTTWNHLAVCLQFDKGLGLLFSLLIVNAVLTSKAGMGLPAHAMGFVIPFYLISGLAAVGLSRHEHEVEKSFLAGYRGLGIILSSAAIAILFGCGLVFLFHPYLFPAADALLAAIDQATAPMVPYLIRFLRYMLTPEHMMQMEGTPDNPDTTQIELTQPPEAGWLVVTANILVWAFIALVIVMAAGLVFYMFKRLLAWLLSKDSHDGSSLTFSAWMRGLLKTLMAVPVTFWHFLASFFKQVDSAAMVYVRLLRWGRHSGVLKQPTETPDEYASRLMHLFPDISQDIRLIVNAFNREIYGLIKTPPDTLTDIQNAQRRMKSIRYWPQRARVWLAY
jgi:hypothetical protein